MVIVAHLHCHFQELWIRLRCLIIQSLALVVNLIPRPVQETQTNSIESGAVLDGETGSSISLGPLIDDLEELLSEIESHPGTRVKVEQII